MYVFCFWNILIFFLFWNILNFFFDTFNIKNYVKYIFREHVLKK